MGYGARKKKQDYIVNPDDLSYLRLKTDELDVWQKEVYEYEGNIGLRAGRQVGKSYIMAKKVAQTLLKYSGIKILITAASERQAMYLYEKVHTELRFATERNIFAETPTMRRTVLKNGSEVYCLPVGQSGDLIRGLTLDIWVPDESAFINRQVYVAITPMLWISKKEKNMGWIWALSTPFGKEGFFYEIFQDPDFKCWKISSEECARIPKETLVKWKKDFSAVEYAQEVLGDFIDEVSRLFPEELLNESFFDEVEVYETKDLGIDVARFGADSNAFVTATFKDNLITIPFAELTKQKDIYETYLKVSVMELQNHYRKIKIDEGGVGGGLVDFLKNKFHSKIIGINNASRAESSDGRRKKIMKEDLYSNAIMLMRDKKIKIKKNIELYNSLVSTQFKYVDDNLVIFSRDNHLAEAFVRAIWKPKNLNIFVLGF